MNMQNLIAQAQKLKKELEKTNEEIENSTYHGKSGAVEVELSGRMQITKVQITDSTVLNDKEMLEDMIMVAVNEALLAVAKVKEEKLGKYAGGLGGLF